MKREIVLNWKWYVRKKGEREKERARVRERERVIEKEKERERKWEKVLARRDTVRMQKDRYYQWMKESKKERNCLKRSRLTEEVRWLVGGGGGKRISKQANGLFCWKDRYLYQRIDQCSWGSSKKFSITHYKFSSTPHPFPIISPRPSFQLLHHCTLTPRWQR